MIQHNRALLSLCSGGAVYSEGRILDREREEESTDFSKLTNHTVRQAIETLQAGDTTAWHALFADNVTMTDDGKPRDFDSFTHDALGTEKFLTIDTVERDGRDVYGRFSAGKWGQFDTFFKFTVGENDKITGLDIGQA